MKNSGTSAGSATGSSRYQTISGSAATNSAWLTTLVTCRAPIASADATATSTSEKPSRSKPVVKVISRGLCRMASAAIAVESMPPDRNAPDGDVGAHVLGHRVLEHRGDLVVAGSARRPR